jgi:hypothetical protein
MKRIVIFGILILTGCTNYGQLQFVTKLPKKLNEVSGIVPAANDTYWVIEDSGNADNLYRVNLKGELLQNVNIKNAKNRDWEALTRDTLGNIYIADAGNNSNKRTDLVIYKVPEPNPDQEEVRAEKIKFHYPEQKRFPPKARNFNYDSEAIFYAGGFLYVINKNRSTPFKEDADVYRVPATAGEHIAELIGSIKTCDDRHWCQVTGAEMSPNGKTLAILGYGNIWLIQSDLENGKVLSGRMESIDHGASSQLEAACFLDNNTLLLADEKGAGGGRNLYTLEIPGH